jgi:DNA anti-recombination protein RmuC
MAVSSIRLPNISNDGICHAILKNNSRCKNPTYKKLNGQYSKWCSVHILQTSINKSYQQLRGYYSETVKDFKEEVKNYIDIMSKLVLSSEEELEYIDIILEMHTLLSGFQNLLQDNENKYDLATNHSISENFKDLLDNYQALTKRANNLTQIIKTRQSN